MNIKQIVQKEVDVAIHAQSFRFRLVKYAVLFALFGGLYAWKGWDAILIAFAVLLPLSFAVHFFYRYKTERWSKAWGGYTPRSDA